MLSRDKLKASSLSTPVPLDMINAWLRGEYLIGQNESSGYELLGWTLMLRGLYVYGVIFDEGTIEKIKETSDSTLPNDVLEKMSAWGICKIDVDEGDITFHGIRLGLHKENFKSDTVPPYLVWYSIFSKLTRVPASSKPDMYFGYVLISVKEPVKEGGSKTEDGTETADKFRWFATLTDEQKAKSRGWIGFELPFVSTANSLNWANMYQEADFRKKLCEYLLEIESDLDRPSLTNKDTVSAIAHLPLENWKPPIRLGLLQPTVGPTGGASESLPTCGGILFFPLMDESLGSTK